MLEAELKDLRANLTQRVDEHQAYIQPITTELEQVVDFLSEIKEARERPAQPRTVEFDIVSPAGGGAATQTHTETQLRRTVFAEPIRERVHRELQYEAHVPHIPLPRMALTPINRNAGDRDWDAVLHQ